MQLDGFDVFLRDEDAAGAGAPATELLVDALTCALTIVARLQIGYAPDDVGLELPFWARFVDAGNHSPAGRARQPDQPALVRRLPPGGHVELAVPVPVTLERQGFVECIALAGSRILGRSVPLRVRLAHA